MEKENKKYYGKVVVAVMALLMFPMSLILNTSTIFVTPVTEALGVSLAQYGSCNTLVMWCCALGAPFLFTPLTKKIKLRWLLAASLVVEAISFAIRANTNSITMFYVTAVTLSFPMGLLCNVCIPIVANAWFPDKPGSAMAVMACTQGLGGMIFCAIGGNLIDSIGYQGTYYVWAAVCLIMAPVAAIFMRNEPAEVGQVVEGDTVVENLIEKELPGMSKKRALATAAFYLSVIGMVLSSFSANVNSYINPYCRSLGLSATLAGYISATIQAGVFIGKITLGKICDKYGMKVGVLTYVITGIACYATIVYCGGNMIAVAIACILIGPLYSSCNLVGPLVVKYLFGQKDHSSIWALYVLVFCIIGGSAGTIWGLVAAKWGYIGAFFSAMVLVILIAVFLLSAFAMRNKVVENWDTPELEEY